VTKKTILFRADSSSTIGTGHIMRDLVLASQYKESKIIFTTQNLDGNINHKILEANYEIEFLNSNDIDEFIALVKKHSPSLVVIDHYGIDYKYEQMLKEKTDVEILAFDDTYEKHHCDIVLNHNLNAKENRYKDLVPSSCEVRCGAKYTLLREEFYQIFPPKTVTDKKTVLIAMGGADSQNLNIKIVEALSSFNITIEIITTTANKNLQELQKYIEDKKDITLHINSNCVATLMYNSDLAIVTPSVSVNEAYFMKLPFIAIQTEQNQQEVYNYLEENNFLVMDRFDTDSLRKKFNLALDILDAKLKNFIDLSEKEQLAVLEYRNHKDIQKWMYTKDEISLENHLNYIKTLNRRKDRVYFLVQIENKNIGVVDLTDIENESVELGIYANPYLKGYGKVLLHKIVDYAFNRVHLKKLYANVYTDNSKAIALYKKFHFQIVQTSQDENGELYNMELKNENR